MPAVKRLTPQTYKDLAAARMMHWWGDIEPIPGDVPPETLETPATGETSCWWYCTRCGRSHYKSYRAVKNREKACRCWNSRHALQPEDYVSLATQYNLKWLRGETLPQSTKEPQWWESLATGQIFEASYNEIKWKSSNRVKAALGLPYRPRGGDFTKKKATADV